MNMVTNNLNPTKINSSKKRSFKSNLKNIYKELKNHKLEVMILSLMTIVVFSPSYFFLII